MCFCNSRASRLNSPCVGGMCMWFDEEIGKCAVVPVKAEAPKAKSKAKSKVEG